MLAKKKNNYLILLGCQIQNIAFIETSRIFMRLSSNSTRSLGWVLLENVQMSYSVYFGRCNLLDSQYICRRTHHYSWNMCYLTILKRIIFKIYRSFSSLSFFLHKSWHFRNVWFIAMLNTQIISVVVNTCILCGFDAQLSNIFGKCYLWLYWCVLYSKCFIFINCSLICMSRRTRQLNWNFAPNVLFNPLRYIDMQQWWHDGRP